MYTSQLVVVTTPAMSITTDMCYATASQTHYSHTHVDTHTRTQAHTRTHARTRTRTHTHTHTHTHNMKPINLYNLVHSNDLPVCVL